MRFTDTVGISHLMKLVEHDLSHQIDSRLQEVGLTMAQYTALSAIEMSKKITNAELARRCQVTPQTINRILLALEASQFVRRSAHPSHGLKSDFALTAKAVKLLCKAHQIVNGIELDFIQRIDKEEFLSLQAILSKLAKGP